MILIQRRVEKHAFVGLLIKYCIEKASNEVTMKVNNCLVISRNINSPEIAPLEAHIIEVRSNPYPFDDELNVKVKVSDNVNKVNII